MFVADIQNIDSSESPVDIKLLNSIECKLENAILVQQISSQQVIISDLTSRVSSLETDLVQAEQSRIADRHAADLSGIIDDCIQYRLTVQAV